MRSSELLSRFIKLCGQRSTVWRNCVLAMLLLVMTCAAQSFAQTPIVGQKAPDFILRTPAGKPVELSKQTSNSTVVLVVLRGFPGYQCPYCQKQVHDFVEHAPEFTARKASVLLVYPGPAADLDQHAREFLEKQANLPPNVTLVTDPEFAMTNLYNLRWNAPSETAYPSTFIIDRKGMITFEKISHSHDDRSTAVGILAEISGK
jgi:thioredoxin-dependent peroxiredoxin